MPQKKQLPTESGIIHLPVFIGFNKGEAIKTLDKIRDSMTDIMIQGLREDCSFNENTISFIVQVYYEATELRSQVITQ